MKKTRVLTSLMFPVALWVGESQAITLHEVIEHAVLNNPSVLEMYNQKISREYEVKEANGGYLPQVDLDAGAGYKRSSSPSTRAGGEDSVTYKAWTVTLGLRQMLFDGFLTKSEKARQKKRVESAFFELYNLAEEVGIAATEAYINVLRTQKLVEYAEENLAAHEKMFDQIEMRSMMGADDQSSLTQMTGRLKLAQSNVESERNNLRDRWTEYLEIVGYLPKDALEDIDFTMPLPTKYEETLDYALNNHPALARSMADVEQFKLQKNASKSFLYPRIQLELLSTWQDNFDEDDVAPLNIGRQNDQSAMIQMNYNLYNGGSDIAAVNRDQFLKQEAEEHLEWQRRRVEKDVAFAWFTYKSDQKRIPVLADYVKSTEDTREAYLKQFQIGERTLLDLLNTENEIFEARSEYITVYYQNVLSKYRILASMGTLLEQTRIHVVTDEFYRNDEEINNLKEKQEEHDEREWEKRDASDGYTDMRHFKMDNEARRGDTIVASGSGSSNIEDGQHRMLNDSSEGMDENLSDDLMGDSLNNDSGNFAEVALASTILFDYKSAELSFEAQNNVQTAIDAYRDKFNRVKNITVIGHTDGIGSQTYNQTLSEQRAQSVARYLESIEGIPDNQIDAIGMGKLEPVASNDSEEGRAQNRRVVLRLEFNEGENGVNQGEMEQQGGAYNE